MEINVFTYDYISDLLRDVKDRKEFQKYSLTSFPYEQKFPKGQSGMTLPDDFTLITSSKDKHFDYENSKNLYENLAGITPAVASDSRLWTYLTHATFWEYMRSRWPIEGVGEHRNPQGRIIDRFFLNGSNLETLTRNGISRLWWFAYLTVDDESSNRYELLEVLLERQDIATGILERAIGSHRSTRLAILRFLKERESLRKNEDETRVFLKYINLSGGVRNLAGLKQEELRVLFEKIYKAMV